MCNLCDHSSWLNTYICVVWVLYKKYIVVKYTTKKTFAYDELRLRALNNDTIQGAII